MIVDGAVVGGEGVGREYVLAHAKEGGTELAAHVREDRILADVNVVGLSERATSLVLVVVSSELVEVDDFLDIGRGSELEFLLGDLGVAREDANFGALLRVDGLHERQSFALHVSLNGNFV